MTASTERELARAVDTSTPIFVLRRSVGEFQHCALAVARSAGRLGIPVWSVASGPGEPAMRSRYVTGELALSPEAPDAEWIEQLISLRPGSERAMLLPVDDLAAVLTGDHQDRLREHFLLPAAPPGVQRRLASKRELWRLCGELDLPTPTSTFPADERELSEQAAEYGYPVVLKRSDPWLQPRDPSAPSVVIAHTREQMLAAYGRMESDVTPQVMLQEYIPGDSDSVWMFNGYAGSGSECLCAFTGRKLRQRGPRTGPTTLGVSTANQPVEDAARRLLRALEYEGIVDMGFRYDRRDGTYKLLDVNPRLGSTFRLFVADNGIDVVRAMHLDLSRRPVPPSVTSSGRTWIDERSDLAASVRLARERTLGVRAWARSLRRIDEAAWWAADDPVPFLAMAARSVPGAARVLMGGAAR